MSHLIRSTVELKRLVEYLLRTFRTASIRGGVVADAANERLKPAIADIEAAAAAARPAAEAEAAAWTAVLGEDAKSDILIGGISDAMRTALGRPSFNRHLAQVFPGGIGAYTKGDPRRQPTMMGLLESRILSCAAPQLTEDQKKEWAAQVATARKSYEEALAKHHPAQALSFITQATYRSTVKMGHEALRAFKRDLETFGLSKAQIFDIIPDATPAPAATTKATSTNADPKAA